MKYQVLRNNIPLPNQKKSLISQIKRSFYGCFLLPIKSRNPCVKRERRIKMDELLTSVNAEQVSDESSQTEQVTSESVNGEVATPQNEKPVQSAEENAKYAAIRREAEQKAAAKAKDEMIAEMYGESHGIYTYADYQKALAEQKAAEERQQFQDETGLDPNRIQPLIEKAVAEHPTVKQASEFLKTQRVDAAVSEFAKEFPDLGIKTIDDIIKLPNFQEINNYVINRGFTLNEAYKLANYGDTVSKAAQSAQQETIKKITANGASSPGSLSAGGESDFISQELFESKKSDQRWVIKNLSKIQKSRQNW